MMNNPWNSLPKNDSKILSIDLQQVEAFNKYRNLKPEFQLQTHLYPEPFIGNPDSPVYLLGLNPGYSSADDLWHRKKEFSKMIVENLHHQRKTYPFYFLDPQFAESPGAGWWLRKCKWLREQFELEYLAHRLFCVELFPYHSKKYKAIPKSISKNGLVPSCEYSVQLVRNAMKEKKMIVSMRANKAWRTQIPELISYPNLLSLRSPQNVALSPNNVIGYEKLVDALKN